MIVTTLHCARLVMIVTTCMCCACSYLLLRLKNFKRLADYYIFEDKKTPARAVGEAKRDEQLEHKYTLDMHA